MITVAMDTNEESHPRHFGLMGSTLEDKRFEWTGFAELPVDVVFTSDGKRILVELKEVSDYLASLSSGHLYEQVLTMRESGDISMVLVLGSDNDIDKAIEESVYSRKTKVPKYDAVLYTLSQVRKFESACMAMGIHIQRWKNSPFKRLLSFVDCVFNGASLLHMAPRPANGEREIAACSMLLEGIGPKLSETLLEDYRLCFAPKPGARKVIDLPGFGKKRAEQIQVRLAKV